jgi:hypothetical protein
MTGVVLRCPNCGTSTRTVGECDACHEAQVRYYCTNHKPGLWLDAPACLQCGAKFGDVAPLAARPARPPTPVDPPTRVTSPELARRADPPPSLPKTSAGPWGRKEGRGSSDPETEASERSASLRDARAAKMREIFEAVGRAGRRSRGATYTTSDTPSARSARGGCLMRFLLLIMFLIIVLPLLLSLVGGALLQMLAGYYY